MLGKHARQAGSLVSPDRLRFDFTHPDALSPEQLDRIESLVNENILNDLHLKITHKPLQQAIEEGAMALFGEKYAETVRTITIDRALPEDGPGELSAGSKHLQALSYELCGGTHVDDTGDIGLFIINSESSAAAGIRRIEAVTGRYAYELVKRRLKVLKDNINNPDDFTG